MLGSIKNKSIVHMLLSIKQIGKQIMLEYIDETHKRICMGFTRVAAITSVCRSMLACSRKRDGFAFVRVIQVIHFNDHRM